MAAQDNVYVANLPEDMTDEALQQVFGAYGDIKNSRLLAAGGSGGKRAALVQFTDPEEAAWIVENLDGNIPEGLAVPVQVRFKDNKNVDKWDGSKGAEKGYGKSYDKGKANAASFPYDAKGVGKGKDGKANGVGKGKDDEISIKVLVDGLYNSGAMPGGTKYTNDDNCVFISGLPSDTTDDDLYKIFTPFGAIAPRGVRAMKDESGVCKGFGFVNFLSADATQHAITILHGTQMPGGRVLAVKVKQEGKQQDGGKADKGKGGKDKCKGGYGKAKW